MQNTSNTARVVRDISVILYHQGRFVDEMTQISQSVNSQKAIEYGGENQSYSFVIPPRSIQKVYCTFVYAPCENTSKEHEFDEIRIKYFDERNKIHEHHVRYVQSPWEQAQIEGDDNWIMLENNFCFKSKKAEIVSIPDKLPLTAEKISYLQMIQEPICRMSTTSAIFKGFAASIVAGVAALTYYEVNTLVLGLSFVPVILFFLLDIYYLRLEKKYRYLYEQVRMGIHVVDFSMKLTKDNKAAKSRIVDCCKSPSIWLFYPVLIAILVAVFLLKMRGVI